ncbi:MAG: hypothetical protein WAN36_10385, partial [Calditrichia bacterium]
MKTASCETYLGQHPLQTAPKTVLGEIITIAGEKYYKISNYDLMPPFFMNIVSDSDLWMFISSNGALTAGRGNPDNALFPYYPDDQIQDLQETTGSRTLVRVLKNGQAFLWEPFSSRYQGLYQTERNIYKNIAGNQVVFEEMNHDLKVSFQYAWLNCDRFGFVRKSWITNNSPEPVTIHILDGIQNILPAGLNRRFQADFSTLADAYKKNELLTGTGLGLFTLSSIPTDTAEPSESLKATAVWSAGLNNAGVLLSSAQLEAFRCGLPLVPERDIRAERGAYLLHAEFGLPPVRKSEWYIVAELNRDHSDIVALSDLIESNANMPQLIKEEIKKSTEHLKTFVAESDGLQLTRDPLIMFRHFSNTLFNIMRGGIFNNNYIISKNDLRAFVQTANRPISKKYASFIDGLPDQLNHYELLNRLSSPDPDFERLCREYLPLTFSRRHGDPTRPWNNFSIDI